MTSPAAAGTSPSPSATTGLVVVDKEAGWTSHDVVARCRRLFGQRRVGHAGTLDPDATGVLIVGLGRATRLLRFLTPLPKTYTVDIVLGAATTTLDASGDVVGRWEMGGVSLEQAREAAARLTGTIEQVPPMVSAVKVGGQRLHVLARQGREVERPARTVNVYEFRLDALDAEGVVSAQVRCSSGTYVRVLAADLGTALGGGAHVRNLRRTAVGSFTEREARPVGELGAAALLAPTAALRDLARVDVPDELAPLVSQGRTLDRLPLGAAGPGPWALVGTGGRLLAVYEAAGGDRLRPAVVMAEP